MAKKPLNKLANDERGEANLPQGEWLRVTAARVGLDSTGAVAL